MKPDLADVKIHLRVDSADENTLIQSFIDAAYAHAADYCRRDFAVEYAAALPDPIYVAILMHVADLFQNREGSADNDKDALPVGYRLLVDSYRNFPV